MYRQDINRTKRVNPVSMEASSDPVKQDTKVDGGSGYTLPGYNYLGPGNDLDSGEPTNKLDELAYQHDLAYTKTQVEYEKRLNSKQYNETELRQWAINEIRKADKDFLNKTKEYEAEGVYDSVAKYIALAGIGTKYLGESVFGQIYPTFRNRTMAGAGSTTSDSQAMKLPTIIGTGIDNEIQKHHFKFKKMFNFHIESKMVQYHKTEPNANAANGMIKIRSFIHTLPWHKLYMYLTHKEYDDIISFTHSAKVSNVSMKIYNLGNRTPFVASSGSVQYANANSQTTIGLWEDLGRIGAVKFGENISAKTLYGEPLSALDKQNQARQVAGEKQSAACQGKFIDNRAEFWYHNGIYDTTTGIVNNQSIESYSYLPALIASAKIFYNATNSIGIIYTKSYSPKDGTFHYRNDAWRFSKYDYLKNRNPIHNVEVRSGVQTAVNHAASRAVHYDNATVDNYLYNNWTEEPSLGFIPSIGIGILPLLSSDGAHEKSILNIMCEFEINIEAQSHGQNILYTAMRNPQPNPLIMGYRLTDHQYGEIVIGHQPITNLQENALENQPEPTAIAVEVASKRRRRSLSTDKYEKPRMVRVAQSEGETIVPTPRLYPNQGLTSKQENILTTMEKKLEEIATSESIIEHEMHKITTHIDQSLKPPDNPPLQSAPLPQVPGPQTAARGGKTGKPARH